MLILIDHELSHSLYTKSQYMWLALLELLPHLWQAVLKCRLILYIKLNEMA